MGFVSTQYVKSAVKKVKEHLLNKREVFSSLVMTPISNGYCRGINLTEYLGPNEVS